MSTYPPFFDLFGGDRIEAGAVLAELPRQGFLEPFGRYRHRLQGIIGHFAGVRPGGAHRAAPLLKAIPA